MTTSTNVIQQLQTDGRTIREVVESNHELVHEVWCRRILRQILQSLEMQYAMQLPHRPITPDTLVVLESGDPMLLPLSDVEAAWSEAGDLHDLAAVIHYAITREYPPAAPLLGRAPGEYSDTFVAAIDRCLSPDPQARPHNIEQLRNLLGIVPVGSAPPGLQGRPMKRILPDETAPAAAAAAAHPAAAAAPATPAAAAAAPMPAAAAAITHQRAVPAEAATVGARAPRQRRLMLVAAAAVLLAALAALFGLLRQTDSRDTVTLALPDDAQTGAGPAAAPGTAPLQPGAPGTAGADPSLVILTDDPDPAGSAAPIQPQAGAALPANPGLAAGTNPGAGANQQLPAAAGATYKLLIKPWGAIQVDGVDRGVSPPLKRLTLPPGEHTIRIVNPNFPEHTVTVTSVKGDSSVIELDFSEE